MRDQGVNSSRALTLDVSFLPFFWLIEVVLWMMMLTFCVYSCASIRLCRDEEITVDDGGGRSMHACILAACGFLFEKVRKGKKWIRVLEAERTNV